MHLNFIRFFTLIMLATTIYGGVLQWDDYHEFFKGCIQWKQQLLSEKTEKKINKMASDCYDANKSKTYDEQYIKIDQYREGVERSLRMYYQKNKSSAEELEFHLTVLQAAFEKLKNKFFGLYTIDL